MKNSFPNASFLKFSFVLLIAFALSLSSICRADDTTQPNPYLHMVGSDGTVRFELNELTKHPHFWWPRTLLNYQVVLNGPFAPPTRWTLTDEVTGKLVPVQVSDIRKENEKIVAATVSFFSDLPTGGHRSFLLHTTASGAESPEPEGGPIVHDDSGLMLDTGALKVRIPDSREIGEGKTAPGPIMAINDGKGWVGESTIDSPKKSVRKITTEILDRGPLFARVRVTYDFAGGARYSATIKAPRGYDFVEFTEEFSGLTVADQAIFHFIWTGLPLTNRRGDEPIDKPHITYYRGEDPHFSGVAGVENPADEFYFRLMPTSANGEPSNVDFSNPATGRAIGLCVLDGSKWDDGEYSIWSPSDTLAVKFRYRDNTLEWMLPLAGKSCQLGIAAYDPKDPKWAPILAQDWGTNDMKTEMANKGRPDDRNQIAFINTRYGGMSLDVIKDWRLTYPDNGRRSPPISLPAENGFTNGVKSLDAYTTAIWQADDQHPNEMLGVEADWFSPVSMRMVHRWVVPGFYKYRDQMTPEMRSRITALLLFHSYLASREELSSMRYTLKGHPNFMADWKYPLMAGAYFFPDHPMAHEWADQFEKFLELASIFYVRPEVKAWDSNGGRWTESIAIYNWAFLGPASAGNKLGLLFDGRDRFANPGMALHGKYLTGIVTAPVKLGTDGAPFDFKPGTPLLPQNGFQRIYPPQGAHAGRHAIATSIDGLADALEDYDPLTAEHLLWVSRHPEQTIPGMESEGDKDQVTPGSTTQGTDPGLHSSKYTGYGFVLRSAVNTPDEISVYLQQVDRGPNYRWGSGNDNGSGDIYYYAGGNSYAGHFGEDAGDRRVADVEFTSNAGVFKDASFRSIGMNVLTEPLYDLGSAQFAEILARPGPGAYSWPEYQSRSVMLVGHDYIVTYDAVNDISRMSWSTIKGQDKMPTIIPVRGATDYHTTQTSQSTAAHGEISESVRYEPYRAGDHMYLVSHRTDLKVAPEAKKKKGPEKNDEVSEVISPESNDFIYQQRDTFHSDVKGRGFSGIAGVIREFKDGHTELNLFKGEMISDKGLQLAVDNHALGVSAIFTTPTEVSGQYYSYDGGKLTVTLPDGIPAGLQLFVNGAPAKVTTEDKSMVVQLPAKGGRWQLTASPAVPKAPEITHTVTKADGATIYFAPVKLATSYRIESSTDGGLTWTQAGTSTTPEFTLTGIKAPAKIQAHVIALNGQAASAPGTNYPIYVTGKAPDASKGLRLLLADNEVTASWGEVLGAKEYVLYRRKTDETAWKEIHRGLERTYVDHLNGIVPAQPDPGFLAAAMRYPEKKVAVYEYAVATVDGVGESDKSSIATTDPTSWRNWYPDTPLRFKRRSAFWLPPYVTPDQVPPAYYPE